MSGDMTWTSEKDAKLIKFVKNHEALYNIKSKEYRKTQTKQNLWNEIGKILQKSGSDCCKRWAYVRDYYIRRKGKPGIGSGGEAAKNRSVLLSFLDSVPSPQRPIRISNIVGDEVEFDESEFMKNTHSDIEENISQVDETSVNMAIIEGNNEEMTAEIEKIIRDKKKMKLNHSEERLQQLKEKDERNSTSESNELDETDLFFNSVVKIIKKLPRYEQVQLRMRISILVGNAELKHILDDSRQNTDSSSRSNSTMSFIHTKTAPSPASSVELKRTRRDNIDTEYWS